MYEERFVRLVQSCLCSLLKAVTYAIVTAQPKAAAGRVLREGKEEFVNLQYLTVRYISE